MTDLNFKLTRGPTEQNFLRRAGQNQSHTVLKSGAGAFVLTAFPAGNCAGAIFFNAVENYRFTLIGEVQPVQSDSGATGVRYSLEVDTSECELRNVIVGSTRDVRDFEHAEIIHEDARVKPKWITNNQILFTRLRLDHRGHYALGLKVSNGVIDDQPTLRLRSPSGPLRLEVEILHDEAQLTPLAPDEIFTPEVLARLPLETQNVALFLTLREKILAGSWRYQTYFGRDPLLMQLYAADALAQSVWEAESAAVLGRLDASGDAAHEESIGDHATRENLKFGRGRNSVPVFDYKMVDTVYLVAIHFHALLNKFGLKAANHHLDRTDLRAALRRNLELVVRRAGPFAERPEYQNLIGFGPGLAVGDWRDSNNGHGGPGDQEVGAKLEEGGHFSFGVNVALVPAALCAAARIFAGGELGIQDSELSRRAERALEVWSRRARPLFQQTVSAAVATERAARVAEELGLKAPPALSEPLSYSALSLTVDGQPIRAIHSDEGFDLLFNRPDEATLVEIARHLLRPVGYGLALPVGMSVVNPFLIEDQNLRRRFDRHEYHGGIWGCEMAKMERGLARQIQREDLNRSVRDELKAAHRALWQILERTRAHHAEELWTWDVHDGQIVYAPFTEANALQTWNLVLLLLQNPYGVDSAAEG